MQDPDLEKVAGKVVKFTRGITEEINRMPQDRKERQVASGALDEEALLEKAGAFFRRDFNAKIHAYREDDQQLFDPQKKAGFARPYRPAIYIE
jgi:leucyl-tRNA synthetase